MKKLVGIVMVMGLLVGFTGPVQAAVMEGTWDTLTSDLLAGFWTEVYGPGGPGQPGTELSAEASDAMQWMLGNVFILAPAVGHDNGDGTVTYTTDYGNAADPGASSLALGEAATVWGDAITFTNVMLTVEATIDMGTGDYVGGTFSGTGEAAGGWVIEISGTLTRTGFLGDPPTGHEGTIDYMEVTIDRIPLIVPLDIKPGSCPNPINVRSEGKLPVAILGTADFDVTMIDLDSLLLARADGEGGTVAPLEGPPGPHSMVEDVGTPFVGEACECHEAYGDGLEDLSMKFDTQAVIEALELGNMVHGDSIELIVTGTLTGDGRPFVASDCVVFRGKAKGRMMGNSVGR